MKVYIADTASYHVDIEEQNDKIMGVCYSGNGAAVAELVEYASVDGPVHRCTWCQRVVRLTEVATP